MKTKKSNKKIDWYKVLMDWKKGKCIYDGNVKCPYNEINAKVCEKCELC